MSNLKKPKNNPLELKIDLNAINHLGINLYSNIPAVLSELIANAWDADADIVNVNISDNQNNTQLTIKDNGCGMSYAELQKKYLTVGYERRKDTGDITHKHKRQVMGRKGIGKLSVFSIAKTVEIHSKKKQNITSFKINVDDIEDKIKNKEKYYPEVIKSYVEIPDDTGTVIILTNLKKRVVNIGKNLKRRISRRFDIWDDDNFSVYVNDDQVSIEDRDYFHLLEYALTYGDYPQDRFTNIESNKLVKRESNSLNLSGWVGFAKTSGSLGSREDDNINKITILSRGKVAFENVLDRFREGGLFTKYLIGEIRADYLDDSDKDDIATSSRQGFIEDDKRFIQLESFLKEELKFLSKERVKLKEAEGEKEARKIPVIEKWLDSLKGDEKQSAKQLFAKINNLNIDDDESKKELYKSGILGFENLRHRKKLQKINQIDSNQLEVMLGIFSGLDDIESTWYYEITKARLEVIKVLIEKVNDNDKEKVIQKYIYKHLWLLDPAWDKATNPAPRIEEQVTTAFNKVSDKLTKEEKASRFDIRYSKTEGKHVIIELKRASVSIKEGALSDQIIKYKNALRKTLEHAGEKNFVIECIALLGKLPQGWDEPENRKTGDSALAQHNIRVITYERLIVNAQTMYKDYLNKQKDIGKISKILDEISNF